MPKKPETFDATKGHYFVVELPDKQWAVFWQHPSQGDWHRQIAKFQDKMRAEAYVVSETQALSPAFANPDIMGQPPVETNRPLASGRSQPPVYPLYQPPKPRVADQVVALAKRIMKLLPKLYDANPRGVPAQVIADAIDTPYAETLAALRYIGRRDLAQWVHLGGSDEKRKFLFPNGVPLPSATLTPLQTTVLDIIKYAMVDGKAEISHKEIARRGEVSAASVPAALNMLIRKKYIHLIRRGTHAGAQAPVYGLGPAPPELETEPDHWITFDDLMTAKTNGASGTELEALERKMWEQNGHDPDKDLYSAEETKARMDTMMRACVGIPAVTAEERALRDGIAATMDKHVRSSKDPAAVSMGMRGAKARAAALSKERRQSIAKVAAHKRWRVGEPPPKGPVEV